MHSGTVSPVRKAPHRRLQFRLAWLFVLMVLAAMALSPEFKRQLVRWGVLPNTKRLITPSYEFQGSTYLAFTCGDGMIPDGVPAHLVLAFPATDDARIVALYVDPETNQVKEVQQLGLFHYAFLCDVSGDGRTELLLNSKPAGDWTELYSCRMYEFADGSRIAETRPQGSEYVRGYVFSLGKRVECRMLANHFWNGSNEIASSSNPWPTRSSLWIDVWADAYGTGRPVLCTVTKSMRKPVKWGYMARDAEWELTDISIRYRVLDERGDWQRDEHTGRRPTIEDLSSLESIREALRGILSREADEVLGDFEP